MRADDAKTALATGMDGIIVSNHGGRQVDGCVAALDALASVRDAVADEVPVLLDGGVRQGSDVVKAMALGASAVLVGRPFIFGLTVGGASGVREVLANLVAETDSVLALCGHESFASVGLDTVVGWRQ